MATAKKNLPEQDLPDPRVQGQDQLLTVREVARELQVSTTSVYRLCEHGRIGTIRIGGSIRVPADEVASYQQRRESEAQTAAEAIKVRVPEEPPQLTPEAARALLKVLQDAADRR